MRKSNSGITNVTKSDFVGDDSDSRENSGGGVYPVEMI